MTLSGCRDARGRCTGTFSLLPGVSFRTGARDGVVFLARHPLPMTGQEMNAHGRNR